MIIGSDFDKVKKVLSELMDCFIDICNEHKLRWCIMFGTLIGAVRDNDFISWDHDADICMPIEDYNEFFRICNEDNVLPDNIYLASYSSMNSSFRNFKLIMKGTSLGRKGNLYGRMFIDIYPMISFKDSENNLKRITDMCLDYRRTLDSMKGESSSLRSETIIDFERRMRCLELEETDCNSTMSIEGFSGYFSDIPSVEKLKNQLFPKIDFDNCQEMKFSILRNKVRIPRNFDAILRKRYGNYLIPKNTQGDWFLDTEHDYSYYKNNRK